MDVILELQTLKEELIREIDEKIEQTIKKLRNNYEEPAEIKRIPAKMYESIYPLNAGTGIYKGKRPTGIIFANGKRVETPTWKKVMEEVRKDFCKSSEKHRALRDLRGKVQGRNRVLLDNKTGNMRSPVQIDKALYVETHYDTETLLRILTTRILDEVGYDYSKIKIAVRVE